MDEPAMPHLATTDGRTGLLGVQTWHDFRDTAGESVPYLVEGVWPERAFGFIAAPAKKGKTWLGLALGLSVASGEPFLGFDIAAPRTVLYVALEGHRAALRDRIGALARGLGLDPDGEDLDRFHVAYKPRGLNLADQAWATELLEAARGIGAELVLVDVLRRAARIKENAVEEFGALRDNLAPLHDDGISLGFLHHFTKLSETSKERDAIERMSGSGSMGGEIDVGVFITGSESGARKLRVEFEGRDLATPETIGVRLEGEGSGVNGSYTYDDSVRLVCEATAPKEDEFKAPPSAIADWVRARGGQATPAEIKKHFGIADGTLRERREALRTFGIEYVRQGPGSVYLLLPEAQIEAA